MKYCKSCVMPDTRPGIKFNEDGICYPCLHHAKQKEVDWVQREEEFVKLCMKHKELCKDKPYDCIVPASGGKDSHYQVFKMVSYGMRPLIVTVSDWFGHTEAGQHNFKNLCKLADSFTFLQDSSVMKEMVKIAFFEEGSPTWPIDAAIYSIPLYVAKVLGIGLVVYGEDISSTYGGPDAEDSPSARKQIKNNVVRPLDRKWWLERGISLNPMLEYPSEDIVDSLEPIYMSYYFQWSGYENYEFATTIGFKDADDEWNRDGCIENYDQIDSLGYMVHPWLKYPKFGHARATDVASNWIREGRISRENAIELVKERDHQLDSKALSDFLNFTGISESAFWTKVDSLYNRELFIKDVSGWILKNPI